MQKTSKKLLISIISFLAIFCFSLSLILGNTSPKIYADGTALTISSIRQSHLEVYNSCADGLGYRSEYVITFNENVFTDSVESGAVLYSTRSKYTVDSSASVTAYADEMAAFVESVTINGSTLKNLTGGCALIKCANNAIRIVTGRPIAYADIVLSANLVLGGKTLSATQNYYQQQDGYFTLSAPTTRKVFAIVVRPNDNYYQLQVWFNKKISGISGWNINGQKINGTLDNIYNNASGHYDNGEKNYAFSLAFNKASTDAMEKPLTLTFPESWSFTNKTEDAIGAAQTFTIGSDNMSDYHDCSFWSESDDVISVNEFKNITTGTEKSVFQLKFNGTTDVLSSMTVGEDVTAYLKEYTNFFKKIKVAGALLSNKTGVTVKKSAVNTLDIDLGSYYASTNISILAGMRFGEKQLNDDKNYLFDIVREDTALTNITAETNYGTMSYENKVRFSLRFSELGILKDVAYGTDLTDQFNNIYFTDYVLVNGVTLTKVAGSSLKVYRGNKDSAIHTGVEDVKQKQNGIAVAGKYDVSDAIEIVFVGQLFDYEVSVLDGCKFADVEVQETKTYQKQFDETFSLVTENDNTVKPIAIREIPYGQSNDIRDIKIIFNNAINLTSNSDLISVMKFNNQTISQDENSLIQIIPNKWNNTAYVNTEDVYAKHQYSLSLSKEDFTAFMMGENPTINIPSIELADGTKTEEVTFTLQKGTWVPNGMDITDYKEPAFTEVLQNGSQYILPDGREIKDVKLVRFITNYGMGAYSIETGVFLENNIYVNGVKAKNGAHSWLHSIETEIKWERNCCSYYIDNNLRNYEGGVDVFFIPRGTPLSGCRIIDKDTYFYAVQDKYDRDGAGNWEWFFSTEKPALNILSGGNVLVNDENGTVTATVNFDRVVDSSNVAFGKKENVDVSSTLKINGKTLGEYTDATKIWAEKSLTITVKKAEIADFDGDLIKLTFLNGFTAPLGYKFDADYSFSYSISDKIWAESFEVKTSGFASNNPVGTPTLSVVRAGGTVAEPKLAYKITVKFEKDIAGGILREGNTGTYITDFINITASYDQLKYLTEIGFDGDIKGAGYEYRDYVINKLVKNGVRKSILNKVLINGEKVGDILAREILTVANENYPLRINLCSNLMEIIIQQDSVLYSTVAADKFNISLFTGLSFSTDTITSEITNYRMIEDKSTGALVFESYAINWSIGVKNMKQSYKLGEDLDLSKILAWYTLSNNEKGENITVTADMISGYDKNKLGEQTVTLTVDGMIATFTVNVVEQMTHESPIVEDNGGCGSNIGGNTVVLFIAITAVAAIIIVRKVLRKD